MSSNGDLKIEVKKAGDGTAMATVNGKIYNLLALYEDWRAGGPFFLIAAGRTPLKADDLAEHWGVIHRGPLSIAFAQRPFSYHLLQGEDCQFTHSFAGMARLCFQHHRSMSRLLDGLTTLTLEAYRAMLPVLRVPGEACGW